MRESTEKIFILWARSSHRSDLLSQTFHAKPYYISYSHKKTLFHTLVRYLISLFKTIAILYRLEPKLIFLLNQPVFLPMVVYFFSRIKRYHYIIDSHSGLLNKRVWRSFIPIMKIIYREALINIAHNGYDASVYESWGVKTIILGTEIYPYESYRKNDLKTTNNIVVIGTYANDEPIHEILLAAEYLNNVHFYITGSIKNAKRVDLNKLPQNVILTDFLPRDKFIGLIKAADAAMTLVTTDNTMQMGAWEALSCETPLILSDWSLLRKTFPKGAIFVENSKMDICNGIISFFKVKEVLKKEISQLKKEKIILWENEITKVRNILEYYNIKDL